MSSVISRQIELAMMLHAQKLRRELPTLSSREVGMVLAATTWKTRTPVSIARAVDDIQKLDVDTIVRTLSVIARKGSGRADLTRLQELIGGDIHEIE